MIGLKKRVRTDGGYADRFKEAFRPESLRTSIWSDQGSDPESAGEDEPHQLGFSPEPDAGNSSAAEETEDRQNSSGLPQGVLASATADELALVGMADLLKRQGYSQESLDNQKEWNNHFQRQLTELRQLITKSCTDVGDLSARVFAMEEKVSRGFKKTGK